MRLRWWQGLWAASFLVACGDDGGDDAAAGRGGDASREDGGRGICTAGGDCEERVAIDPPSHVQGEIDYADEPPAGGFHNPCWTRFGEHEQAARPENWVHNLEHGAVVYLHDCPDGCADELATLRALIDDRPFALLTPYPGLPARFAVVAWGYRLQSDELDREAFEAFYDAHVDQAPESTTSPPPSGCP
jgi:hypothetical protein